MVLALKSFNQLRSLIVILNYNGVTPGLYCAILAVIPFGKWNDSLKKWNYGRHRAAALIRPNCAVIVPRCAKVSYICNAYSFHALFGNVNDRGKRRFALILQPLVDDADPAVVRQV